MCLRICPLFLFISYGQISAILDKNVEPTSFVAVADVQKDLATDLHVAIVSSFTVNTHHAVKAGLEKTRRKKAPSVIFTESTPFMDYNSCSLHGAGKWRASGEGRKPVACFAGGENPSARKTNRSCSIHKEGRQLAQRGSTAFPWLDKPFAYSFLLMNTGSMRNCECHLTSPSPQLSAFLLADSSSMCFKV